ncbi:MAG: hypothetical protein JJ969_12805 [Rhizobiaceae bacterium]|nr:hypothetical protein [Rhizobiaceae bacterium]
MKLLFGRAQKSAVFSLVPLRLGTGVMFHLHAELELDEEEKQLLKKYKFERAVIVASDTMDDLKKSIRPAALVAIVAFGLAWLLMSLGAAIAIAFLVFCLMTAVYFNAMREQILVSDFLNGGRSFPCDSVVELIHKEAFLENTCGYLRQVLESAKHWNDREIIPIAALDKKVAKLIVLRGSSA